MPLISSLINEYTTNFDSLYNMLTVNVITDRKQGNISGCDFSFENQALGDEKKIRP